MRESFVKPGRTVAVAAALGLVAGFCGAQTFEAPQSMQVPDGALVQPGPPRFFGGVPGGLHRGVPVPNYDGLRVDGYPSNRNLTLDDRTPTIGPPMPTRREPVPQSNGRFGAGAPGWGSMHQQPTEPARSEGGPQRRF